MPYRVFQLAQTRTEGLIKGWVKLLFDEIIWLSPAVSPRCLRCTQWTTQDQPWFYHFCDRYRWLAATLYYDCLYTVIKGWVGRRSASVSASIFASETTQTNSVLYGTELTSHLAHRKTIVVPQMVTPHNAFNNVLVLLFPATWFA